MQNLTPLGTILVVLVLAVLTAGVASLYGEPLDAILKALPQAVVEQLAVDFSRVIDRFN